MGEMQSSISELKISGCHGSNLLSCSDDKSLTLPTVELLPVCSHPVFYFGKADGDGLKELIKVPGLGAVIELSVIRKEVIF